MWRLKGHSDFFVENDFILHYHSVMKQLSAFFVIITLLAVSILPSVPCDDSVMNEIHCGDTAASKDDSGKQDGNKQLQQCDKCASCHNHGSQGMTHISFSVPPMVSADQLFIAGEQTHLSQLHYLPSRPPQA